MTSKFQLFIFFGLAYILGCNFCRADLGETYAQMLVHYEAMDPEDEHPDVNHPNKPFTCGFLKGPYSVIASFQNGVVTNEMIAKMDHSRFSDAEITNFLKENCLANKPWRGPVLIDEVKHWVREDGASLKYDFGGGPFIILESPENNKQNGIKNKKQTPEQLTI